MLWSLPKDLRLNILAQKIVLAKTYLTNMLWPKKILVLAKKIFDYSCCGLKISTGQQIIGLFMLWPKKISTGQQNI